MYGDFKFLSASIVSIVLGIFPASVVKADINIPAGMGLAEPLYFMSPGGDPIQVPAGLYHVDTVENGLQLSLVGDTQVSEIVVEAAVASHDEALSTERAFLMPISEEQPELQSLVLYSPDGTAYEAVGSRTGVWSRGWKSMFNQTRDKLGAAAKNPRMTTKQTFRRAQQAGRQVYKRFKRTVDPKRLPQRVQKIRKKNAKITHMIMKTKNQAVDQVLKMMRARFAAQQKLQGAVTSRGVTPNISVDECTKAAKSAMTQTEMNEP